MDTFFCPELKEGLCTLPEEESHHLARVLRKQAGARVRLIDGKGKVGTGTLVEVHKKQCQVLVEKLVTHPRPAGTLDIAIAPTKNMDRFEWFLEKATELGVAGISPLLTRHSERKKIRRDKLEKKLLAATKQSLRAFVPVIRDMMPMEEWLHAASAKYRHKWIAYCGEADKKDLHHAAKHAGPSVVLIGPEGGFAREEVEMAHKHGFVPLTLGENRLRTETAAVLTAAAFYL